MALQVRHALSSELPAIAELLVDSYGDFKDALGASWDQMERSLRSAPTSIGAEPWIVGSRGAELVGVVAYFSPGFGDSSLFEGAWSSVRMLGVRPTERSRGVGRALTQACIERARADDAPCLGLHTSELMTGAQALYDSMGFRRLREVDRRFGVRYWVYVLDLTPGTEVPAV